MEKNNWENYGDITPQEGGRYLNKTDGTSYDVIEVKYDYDEEKFYLDKYYIDLDDIDSSWIEKEDVMKFIGMTSDDFDPLFFMLGAVDYYGASNFGCSDYTLYSEEDMLSELKRYGIEV